MSSLQTDIVVLGATGFTGRLITRYLALHPQHTRGLFSFAVAARSQSRLHELVQDLSLPPQINTIRVDVTNDAEVESVVKSARVVINTVGPYWRWGTPVVRACVKSGTHYVDLTGESYWIKSIIDQFDYLATKTGAIIVPSCGMDSIPSDVTAFLANKALKAYGELELRASTTAFKVRGGISGGTLGTMMSSIEEVPKEKLRVASMEYALSPVKGLNRTPFNFSYSLDVPGAKTLVGAFFFMKPTNKALVQRTFGLLELEALKASGSTNSRSSVTTARRERYGPNFSYDEFIVMPSRLAAIMFSAAFAIGFGMLTFVRPFRWLVKKCMTQPGGGPSDESMEKGFIECTNITTSTSDPPVYAKSVFTGNGDPGYLLTAIMISESALSLLLPPVSVTNSSGASSQSGSLPTGLPSFARRGGILTPMTAFGDVLLTRLTETGRFEFKYEIVGSTGSAEEGRKNV
ncbi:Saccharopine dehydrogenase-domain-containing protein [Collybia nuda]|uniref:Saccharopine dehydrogenase-domain-containing protein n=1 Tax=Collybia nuda TaxID=64659 RepID=A0A9P6CE21_9AGAR|nr:Saccharopine dehydrogenase-domain-containing protein [Collybia nuda]